MAAAPFLIVCDFNAHGGTQTQILELLAALDRSAWSPRLCTLNLDGELARKLTALEVPVSDLALRGAFRPGTLASISRLGGWIRDEGVKVVHGFLMQGNLVAAIAARRAGVPYLTSVRNLELWKRPHEVIASRWAHASAVAVTFNSRSVRDLVAGREGIPRAKTRVIRNGLAFTPGVGRSPEPGPASLWPSTATPRLLCVASLFKKKGHRHLIDAFSLVRRSLPDASLVLVGDGPERGDLEQRMRAFDLGRSVVFAGQRGDARALIAAADLLLLASIEEGMPNVLLEAMAAGVPQIATSVGGSPEAIEDGRTGFLVPPRDPVLMAERVIQLARDASLRERMSRASKARFAALFGPDRLAREHEALYEEALGARR